MTERRIYSCDVKVWATAYIVADSLAEARRIADELRGDGIDAEDRGQVSGDSFDHPDLPDVTYSPAMTVEHKGRWRGRVYLNEVVDVTDDSDEED